MERGNNLIEAASVVSKGGVIAYPTEGVFGLGCDPAKSELVERVIALKDRSTKKGLILIAGNRKQLEPYTDHLAPDIEAKLEQSWPGPVTWILPAAIHTSTLLTGGRNTIAARVTAFQTAADLCRACGHALVSTSANRSGDTPCTNAEQVEAEFPELDYIVDLPVGSLTGPTPIFDGVNGQQLR